MNKLSQQAPITTGSFIGSYNASSVNDTDWHDLSSSDFYDTNTGTQLASGLTFSNIAVYSNNSSSLSYVKFRARVGAGDGITNTDGVIPVASSFTYDLHTLEASNPSTIAYKKANGADTFTIIASFVRG
jgi:hypothetical protein